MNKISVFLLVLLTIVLEIKSQECDDPLQVCFNNQLSSLNNATFPPGSDEFCFTADNSMYFSVTSNSMGGDIDITINGIECAETNIAGLDLMQELEAVLFSVDENFPCQEMDYTTLDCSLSSDSEIILQTTADASTTYYVMVDGASDALNGLLPGQCTFDIDATGPGIENDFTAGPDFEIELGDEVEIQAEGFGTIFSWDPPTGLDDPASGNPTATPAFTTPYALTSLIDGCEVTDTMIVFIIPQIVPFNAFTPNEDGFYDTWTIPNIFRFPKADVKVYSRWGQVVFRSIGYNTPWDGTFNGNRLPVATYYYVIQLNNDALTEEENLKTGSVAIVY